MKKFLVNGKIHPELIMFLAIMYTLIIKRLRKLDHKFCKVNSKETHLVLIINIPRIFFHSVLRKKKSNWKVIYLISLDIRD